MRTLHDAILVGIGTALNDDPQLNSESSGPIGSPLALIVDVCSPHHISIGRARRAVNSMHLPHLSVPNTVLPVALANHPHTPSSPPSPRTPHNFPRKYRLPRPVILDTRARTSPDCKLLKNYRAGTGRRPWIRKAALDRAGACLVEVPADRESGTIGVPVLLEALGKLGVRSVMVEGGARVIRSFVRAARGGPGAVDALVVTVAPRIVGDAGVGYGGGLRADDLPTLEPVRTAVFGPDAVVAMRAR
ncbi:dihydrofolate reductase [Epithele typhae]|uniref:dihydrofolate reductase n=1 Tax=Epithele typhae TaxID=378194 RepID=UPI002007AC0B|nr:dihydrofolate reductase [Epithele typhae]KAH9920255.1 dihydrofolate reductase [Epithele typhae]